MKKKKKKNTEPAKVLTSVDHHPAEPIKTRTTPGLIELVLKGTSHTAMCGAANYFYINIYKPQTSNLGICSVVTSQGHLSGSAALSRD